MRGQAAFEYLMTYSWAIIIIGIVVGLLFYYQVFNPGAHIKPEAFGFSTFYIPDGGWKVLADGSFTLIVSNQIDHSVEIEKLYIDNDVISVSVDLDPGDSATILNNHPLTDKSGAPGGAYRLKMTIEYKDTITTLMHNDTGTIVGKYE